MGFEVVGFGRRWFWFFMLMGAFLVGTLMPGTFPWRSVDASPQDVRGSDNVAVCSYTTREGQYVLWAGGRITKAPNGQAVTSTYGGPPPGYAAASRSGTAPVGAPAVAVGVVTLESGTYVLFSDGSIKKPNDPGASAPAPSVMMESVWGAVRNDGAIESGSGNFTAGTTSLSGGGTGIRVTFQRPFKAVPSVVAIAETSSMSRKFIDSVATTSGATFKFSDQDGGGAGGGASVPCDFYFVAVGK